MSKITKKTVKTKTKRTTRSKRNVSDEIQYTKEEVTQDIIGRTGYSDEELNEFKEIINSKLEEAKEEYIYYRDQIKDLSLNDDSIKFSSLEDGSTSNDHEYLTQMANRQSKFIKNLENALIRIENKTYGICRKTGNLIDKKRLKAVPHATLSIEAKLKDNK